VLSLMGAVTSESAFLDWGWRVPFLLSGLLLIGGLWVRARVGETAAFVQDHERSGEKPPAIPIVELLRTQWRQTLLAIGARLADAATFNVINVFAMAYAANTLGLDGSVMLTGFMISSALQIALIPVFGRLSDRVGRRPIYATGATICGLGVFGYFWALAQGSTPVVWAAIIIMHAIGTGMMFSIQSSFFSELFGTSVRYSGISIGYQASGLLAGAPTPAVAAALVAWAGGASWPVSTYLFLMCVITLVCLMLTGETSRRSLTGSGGGPVDTPYVAEPVAMTPVVDTASAAARTHQGGVRG
jgi:MFS transporter, MHS family, shikimate and dehydroshikimate transport protein